MYTAEMARKDLGTNKELKNAVRQSIKSISTLIKNKSQQGYTSLQLEKSTFPPIKNLPKMICLELDKNGFGTALFDKYILIVW